MSEELNLHRIYRTTQHINVLNTLNDTSRYVLSPYYVCNEMNDAPEHKHLVMECYDWLAGHMVTAAGKPQDASYPIWLTPDTGSSYPASDEGAVLTLEIPDEYVSLISIERWTAIMDYRYLPADEEDAKRHAKLLADYGTSDAKSYMSQFYPDVKREILESWPRVFETEGLANSQMYGLVWELKKEWLR